MKIMFIVYHDIKTEARSQEILKCAKKLGNETILVSYSTPFDLTDCKLIVTGNGKRNYFSFIRESIKAIKDEEPDIVILHDNYTSTILRWLVRKRKDIFVIYDSSELYIDRKPKSLKGLVACHMNYFEKKYLKYADVVIAANIERAKIMKDYFLLSEMPVVFDNIHRIDDIYDQVACDNKYGQFFESDTFCIVYAGGISKQRLTFELAEAIGSLGSKYRLIVAGMTNEKEKKIFYKMLEKNNWSNIHYVGFISRAELRYLFKKAHVSVSIFAQDTVNNVNCASGKVYESLFEGTPILTSENPPLKRLCESFKVGVSTNNFKKGILELEKNYDYYFNNVERFTKTLDVERRIDLLAEQLRQKIEDYRSSV